MTGFQRVLRLFIPAGLFLTVLASCHKSKYLAENQTLYTANKTQVQSSVPMKKSEQKKWSEEMRSYLRPKLNGAILGIRVKLCGFYNIAGTTNKKKGFKHWLKYKVGEPPSWQRPRSLGTMPKCCKAISRTRAFSTIRLSSRLRSRINTSPQLMRGRLARAIRSGRSIIPIIPM